MWHELWMVNTDMRNSVGLCPEKRMDDIPTASKSSMSKVSWSVCTGFCAWFRLRLCICGSQLDLSYRLAIHQVWA